MQAAAHHGHAARSSAPPSTAWCGLSGDSTASTSTLQRRVAQLHDVTAGGLVERDASRRRSPGSRATTKCAPPVPSPRSTAVVLSSTLVARDAPPRERRVVRAPLPGSVAIGRHDRDAATPPRALLGVERPAPRRVSRALRPRHPPTRRRRERVSASRSATLICSSVAVDVGHAARRERAWARPCAAKMFASLPPPVRVGAAARCPRRGTPPSTSCDRAGVLGALGTRRTRGSRRSRPLPPRVLGAPSRIAAIHRGADRLDARAIERAALAGDHDARGDDVGRTTARDRADVRGGLLIEPAESASRDRVGRHARSRETPCLGLDPGVARAPAELSARTCSGSGAPITIPPGHRRASSTRHRSPCDVRGASALAPRSPISSLTVNMTRMVGRGAAVLDERAARTRWPRRCRPCRPRRGRCPPPSGRRRLSTTGSTPRHGSTVSMCAESTSTPGTRAGKLGDEVAGVRAGRRGACRRTRTAHPRPRAPRRSTRRQRPLRPAGCRSAPDRGRSRAAARRAGRPRRAPTATARSCSATAAPMKSRNSGAGRVGRLLNSG